MIPATIARVVLKVVGATIQFRPCPKLTFLVGEPIILWARDGAVDVNQSCYRSGASTI